MSVLPEDVLKLLLAVAIGGLIGLEREARDKAAGFRTMILICVGAALFTIVSIRIGSPNPDRIAANIVTGVGFLGAGAIMRDARQVTGLTTAATIWLTAALGAGIGIGQYALSSAGAVIAAIVLWLFPLIELRIDRAREMRTYEVVCPMPGDKFEQLDAVFRRSGLRVWSRKRLKRGDEMVCIWDTGGSPASHARVVEQLLADADLKEVRY